MQLYNIISNVYFCCHTYYFVTDLAMNKAMVLLGFWAIVLIVIDMILLQVLKRSVSYTNIIPTIILKLVLVILIDETFRIQIIQCPVAQRPI